MRHIALDNGKSKSGKRPYMRLFTSDYRDGTANLSFELQGFYFRILTYLHDGEAVPSDPIALARFMQCNARTTRAFLPKLFALGKLYESNGLLRNPRIDRETVENRAEEIEPAAEFEQSDKQASARRQLDVSPTSARRQLEKSRKPNKIKRGKNTL